MMKERLVKKAKARLACVSKAISEGVTFESGENLWRTLVRPILEYACEVWASGKWPEARRVGWTLRGWRDLCRLTFFGKLARMGEGNTCRKSSPAARLQSPWRRRGVVKQ